MVIASPTERTVIYMASKSGTKSKSIVVELPGVDDKKSVTRFNADDDKAPTQNIYVTHDALAKIGGAENGVRVTIEAL